MHLTLIASFNPRLHFIFEQQKQKQNTKKQQNFCLRGRCRQVQTFAQKDKK
jgi:hypothetical protein